MNSLTDAAKLLDNDGIPFFTIVDNVEQPEIQQFPQSSNHNINIGTIKQKSLKMVPRNITSDEDNIINQQYYQYPTQLQHQLIVSATQQIGVDMNHHNYLPQQPYVDQHYIAQSHYNHTNQLPPQHLHYPTGEYLGQQPHIESSLFNSSNNLKRARSNLAWDVMYSLLLQYGIDHDGDHNIPKSGIVTLIDGTKAKLGEWLKSQRKLRRTGKLLAAREHQLQQLVDQGTLFWDSERIEIFEDKWERNFQALVHYAKTNGHCDLPPNFNITIGDVEIPIGNWLQAQYKSKKSGKLGALRTAKLQKLIDENYLHWDSRDSNETTAINRVNEWRKFYSSLLIYGSTHENYNVPSSFVSINVEDGSTLRLGNWLNEQRNLYKTGKLSFEILAVLQQLVNQGKLSWDDDFSAGPSSSSTPVLEPRKSRLSSGRVRKFDGDESDGSYYAKLIRADTTHSSEIATEEGEASNSTIRISS